MSRKKAYYSNRMKRAVHLLFYKRHRKPGVKGWELRKALGADYQKILKVLNRNLALLDLQVKTVFDDGREIEEPTLDQLNKARFLITLKGTLKSDEAKMVGWRIDDLAGLAISIAYIISKEGKSPRTEIEELLRKKLPQWKVSLNVDRYIRYGYLTEDDAQQLYLDWRTHAEVDQKTLIDLILSSECDELQPLRME